MNIKAKLLIAGTAAAALSSCSVNNSSQPNAGTASPPLPVEAFVAESLPVRNTIVVSGSLLPMEQTELRAEISASVVKVLVSEGSAVSRGDLLIKLFDEDLLAQRSKLNAQLDLANETVKRLSNLTRIEGVSRQEFDQAMVQVKLLESELEINRVAISKTEIRAPYNGVVGLRNVSPGSYVTPAVSLLTIRQTGDLKLDFAVAERFAQEIHENLPVRFTVEGDTSEYMAKVVASERAIDTDTRSLKVRATASNKSGKLTPGAFAEVIAELGGKRNSIFVPTQCIVPQGRKKSVVLIRNGAAQFAPVITGLRMQDKIEILEGLNLRDTVATTGILFLKPNAPVKVAKVING